jgi:hypothetical protein
MYLESGADLHLAPVTVNGEVKIDSLGDIKGAVGAKGAVITAANAALSSLGGDIGASSVPLLVYLDRISAAGENVYIKNLKSLIIDTITGGKVSIEADGDITAGTPAGGGNENNIIADELTLNADGNIGADGQPLVIDTDGLTGNAKNLYLKNKSGKLVIKRITANGKAEIQTAGNITDNSSSTGIYSSIRAGSLNIDAFGSIGEPGNPLDAYVPGIDTVNTESAYGTTNLTNWYKSGGGNNGGGGGGGGGPAPKR